MVAKAAFIENDRNAVVNGNNVDVCKCMYNGNFM